MASRKDELRAYQFLKQRVVSALVTHETDPEQPPFRRPAVSSLWGVALALIGLAIAGGIGLFAGGDDKPTIEDAKSIVVDDQGAKFVSIEGKLYQAANYSSALLAVGKNVPKQDVKASQLVGLTRGKRHIGITGAPDQLAKPDQLLNGSWNMCTESLPNDDGGRVQKSAMLVGTRAPGGESARGRMVYVTSGGKNYVIMDGIRHTVTDQRAVTIGLGLDTVPPIPVAGAWVNVFPAGTPLGPVAVSGTGGKSKALAAARPETRIGQVFVVSNGSAADRYYLASGTDLIRLSEFQKEMQLNSARTARAYSGTPRAIPLTAPDVSVVGGSRSAARDDLPNGIPTPLTTDSTTASACASFSPGNGVPSVTVGPRMPDVTESPTGGGDRDGIPLADYIVVPPGRAALIAIVPNAAAAADKAHGTYALVTDSGKMYPFADQEVAEILGYQGVEPVRISATLAARLPLGPLLDKEDALKPTP